MSQPSFADLGVSAPIREKLARHGCTEPFAVQRLVIGDALAGHDLLVRSPTGSGKTLAFAIPLVQRLRPDDGPGSGLVVAPTRELALQITDEVRRLGDACGLRTAAVYGGAGLAKQAKLARRAHIIVATPGRLLDLMGRGAVDLSHLKMLVLDEADRMLDMGFRPDIDRIVDRTPGERQTMLFSATLGDAVTRIAKSYARSARRHESGPAKLVDEADHRFIAVSHETKLDALVSELRAERELTLIFVRTKRGADRLVKRLSGRGITAAAMHGNKSQGQRERALAAFASSGVDALVATDVAARGIDVDGISHVINFDPPADHDAYQHRVGRTARAGRGGVGITLVKHEEAHDVGTIAAELALGDEFASAGFALPPSRRTRSRSPHARGAAGRQPGRSRSRSRSRSRRRRRAGGGVR
jgi:superfamily II DNA/RNA helicase